MILIADSGSTKTKWILSVKESNPKLISTSGINPFFRTTDNIYEELKKKLKPQVQGKVEQIFFYGAGIVNVERGNIIQKALSRLFPESEIEIHSDLLAAARATLVTEPGIACILGTGSNSCLYDGDKIVSHVPPLGYILGDEGSGNAMGRKLVADYLRKIMPVNTARKFQEKFPMDYDGFLSNVYRNENVRMFLAGFAPFLLENQDDDYCRTIVFSAFEDFLKRNIFRYPNYETIPVSFVGSIAFYFRSVLIEVLSKHNLESGVIIKDPLENLNIYHESA